MSSIERTAYPRFATGRTLQERELKQFYSLSPDELRYMDHNLRGDKTRLNFSVQLKTFQKLGYFPELKDVPNVIVEHIKKCLRLLDPELIPYYDHSETLYRHRDRICDHLKIKRWRKNKTRIDNEPIHPGRHFAINIAYQSAQTMNNPADIINVVIEEMINHRYELPPFNQLNNLVKHARSLANRKIFKGIHEQLNPDLIRTLDDLFTIKPGYTKTGYHSAKALA